MRVFFLSLIFTTLFASCLEKGEIDIKVQGGSSVDNGPTLGPGVFTIRFRKLGDAAYYQGDAIVRVTCKYEGTSTSYNPPSSAEFTVTHDCKENDTAEVYFKFNQNLGDQECYGITLNSSADQSNWVYTRGSCSSRDESITATRTITNLSEDLDFDISTNNDY